MSTPAQMFASAARPDPARPFLTYYDDAGGERTELSYTTFDNWVAKTANMIVEDLAARPGQRFSLLLPTHWQTVVWYVACWTAGVVAAPGADPASADHVVCGPAELGRAQHCPGEKVLVRARRGPNSPADPAVEAPAGTYDYAAEVPAYPDRFVPFAVVDEDVPALERDGHTVSGAALVAEARAGAERWGITGADRVLTTVGLDTRDGLAAGLLAPLAVGASVVLCRDADPAALDRRVATERVTRRLPG